VEGDLDEEYGLELARVKRTLLEDPVQAAVTLKSKRDWGRWKR